MDMRLTKREKYMLTEALDFPVHRYLLANTYGREDPNERAERHLEISRILVGFIICRRCHEFLDHKLVKSVHDYLAEILTDRMDEVIGFPVFERPRDYDEMVRRFVGVIINNLGAIKLAMETEE